MTEKSPDMPEQSNDESPQAVVEAASIDTDVENPKKPRKKPTMIDRPYPRRSLEDALRVPTAIRVNNNGNPWPPIEVAKSLGMGTGSTFFYLTQSSRDFALTEGTREAAHISLTDLGRKVVFPNSPQDAADAKYKAFLGIPIFKEVATYYGGSNLPGDEFVRNTLQTKFHLDPQLHDEFIDLFKKNCRFVGIGADWSGRQQVANIGTPSAPGVTPTLLTGAPPISTLTKQATANGEHPVCFVIMPFSEHTDAYATGFFTEVFASLFKPAIEAAGFTARTALRQGSDVIQMTIVNELINADLVLCDLTEHNPNVLFELGVRMALEKPIVLVKAKGTNPIFDVDHMLRVESYNPNMWPSTVKSDVPKISAHIKEAYNSRDAQPSYLSLLSQVPSPMGLRRVLRR